jgi:hypothetical protein
MDGLRRKLWGIEVRAPRIEEETGERREERRELVAWIPAWILCCNMLPFPSCVLFFLTYNSFIFFTCFSVFFFSGISSTNRNGMDSTCPVPVSVYCIVCN